MRQQLWQLVICGFIIGVLSLVAYNAAAFFWTQWSVSAEAGNRVTAVVFAPFALVAIAIPGFAVPMMRRTFGAFVAMTAPRPQIEVAIAFVVLWIAAECVWFSLRAFLGANALPVAMHVLHAAYAGAGAFLFRDGTTSDDKSESS